MKIVTLTIGVHLQDDGPTDTALRVSFDLNDAETEATTMGIEALDTGALPSKKEWHELEDSLNYQAIRAVIKALAKKLA